MLGGEEGLKHCRTPDILADAAHLIFDKPAKSFTGHFLIDDTFLAENGVDGFRPLPRRSHPGPDARFFRAGLGRSAQGRQPGTVVMRPG